MGEKQVKFPQKHTTQVVLSTAFVNISYARNKFLKIIRLKIESTLKQEDMIRTDILKLGVVYCFGMWHRNYSLSFSAPFVFFNYEDQD